MDKYHFYHDAHRACTAKPFTIKILRGAVDSVTFEKDHPEYRLEPGTTLRVCPHGLFLVFEYVDFKLGLDAALNRHTHVNTYWKDWQGWKDMTKDDMEYVNNQFRELVVNNHTPDPTPKSEEDQE